jgi:outer membrane receptor for ferric coprogen and ferric-rhodotorulic acid
VPGTVHIHGGQALVLADFGGNLTANANYTFNTTKTDGVQLDRIPKGLFKAGVDLHPVSQQFGVSATVNYTGDITRTINGFGSIDYGHYAVVDLSGRYYLDAGRHQMLNLSIRNLFDRVYGLPNRGCGDVTTDGAYDCSAPYVYLNLGEPRTFALSYTYKLD